MTQIDLEFGPDARARECWSAVLAAMRAAIDSIGHKELAYRLDVAPSLLSEALNERERKHVQARWLPTILLLAPDPHRRAILDALAGVAGYEVTARKVLSPAEKLARLEEAVRSKLGAVGEELLKTIDR